MDTFAFRRWGFPPGNEIGLFISRQKVWDAEKEFSVFDRSETCGEIEVGSRYVAERRLKVTLGKRKEGRSATKEAFLAGASSVRECITLGGDMEKRRIRVHLPQAMGGSGRH